GWACSLNPPVPQLLAHRLRVQARHRARPDERGRAVGVVEHPRAGIGALERRRLVFQRQVAYRLVHGLAPEMLDALLLLMRFSHRSAHDVDAALALGPHRFVTSEPGRARLAVVAGVPAGRCDLLTAALDALAATLGAAELVFVRAVVRVLLDPRPQAAVQLLEQAHV